MKVVIDHSVSEFLPNLSLGVIHYTGASITDAPKLLQGRINLFVESLRLEHALSQITEIEGVREWRASFKKLGIDPSRYRPSSESLLRRLLQGNPFFWVNSAVDVNNFLSIHYGLPLGIYDEANISDSVICRIGHAEDNYDGLNGREVQMNGKLLLSDGMGAFGSPIVDSVRTRVSNESKNLLQVIFFHEQISPNKREEILGTTARMFIEINGGEVTVSYLATL